MIKSPVVNRAIFIYGLAAIDELTTLDGINHFHIAHNKPRLPSPSPEKKTLCLSVVFNFSWIDRNTREKLKTMFTHNLASKQGGEYKNGEFWDLSLRRFTVLETRKRLGTEYWARMSLIWKTLLYQLQMHSPPWWSACASPFDELPSSKNPHFQNEAKCTNFLVKKSFICMRMKNHFHNKGWALNLVLIQRPGGTQEWPIDICCCLSR